MQAYGLAHLVPLSLLTAGIVAVVWLGRHQRGAAEPTGFSRAFAVAIPLVTIPLQTYDASRDFDIGVDLPFHLCDLAWITTAVALWTHHRFAVALTCFWGLTLSIQGVLTPSVTDFPTAGYFNYWSVHLMIVIGAVYLIFGLKLLPTWRDYRWTIAATAAWAVAAYALSLATDGNYGYLREKPPIASALDLLGPWPVYILNEILIIATVWALITLGFRAWAAQDGSTRTPVRS